MVPAAVDPRDDAYERALRDPAFLEAVGAAHQGSWDVLDALWWTRHPDDVSPSGKAAPLARMRELQRRVFAPDADAVGDPVVAGALRELEREIARESLAIDAAVVTVRFAESRGGAAGAPLLVQAPAVTPEVVDGAGPSAPDEPEAQGGGTGARTAGFRARLRLAAYLTGAVLLGLVIGGQLAAAPAPGGPPTPTTSRADGAPASILALAIFDRARIATDFPAVPVPETFDRASVRAVWNVSWNIAGPRAEPPYFVARAARGRVCLLVMVTDDRHASTCVRAVEFAESGMRIFWTADSVADADGAAAPPHSQNLMLEWTPAGRFEVESADPARRMWPRGLCPTDLPRPC